MLGCGRLGIANRANHEATSACHAHKLHDAGLGWCYGPNNEIREDISGWMNQRIEFGRQRTTLVSEPKKAFGTDFPDSNGCQPFPALIRPRTVSQGPTNVRESVHTCAAATRTSCVGLSMAIATRVSTDGKDPKENDISAAA